MKSVNRLLLGSAAGIFVIAKAQAADVPVKAQPTEYVKVCSLYGAGFWYIPGTDTCIKLGGAVYLMVGENWNGQTSNPIGTPSGGAGDGGGQFSRDGTNYLGMHQRGALSMDVRTQTDYGTARSYISLGADWSTQAYEGNTNPILGTAAPATTNTTGVFVDRAFVQFAGFTIGRIRSFFDINSTYGIIGARNLGDTSTSGILGLAYTWQFAGGLSTSFSLEDSGYASGARVKTVVNLDTYNNTGTIGSTGTTTNGGTTGPFEVGNILYDNKGQTMLDPILNLRIDQAWGFAGLSLALHDASGGYYSIPGTLTTTTSPAGFPLGTVTPPSISFSPIGGNGAGIAASGAPNGHPADKYGWAAQSGFTLANFLGLQGDTLSLSGAYTQGAASYATKAVGPWEMFGNGNSVGLGWLVDGIFANGTQEELTTVWSLYGGYEHLWTPKWRTAVYGGFTGVDYDKTAFNLICNSTTGVPIVSASGGYSTTAVYTGPSSPHGFTTYSAQAPGIVTYNAPGFQAGTVSNCSPNFSFSTLGVRTFWNPVPDINVGFDVVWTHLNTAFAGTAGVVGVAPGRPSSGGVNGPGTYSITNQDEVTTLFLFTRTFLY
jgi:hypothetical protein